MKEPDRKPKRIVEQELEEMIPEIAEYELSLKQMRFLAAYIATDFNATEAYHACNSSEKTEFPHTGGCTNRSAAKKGCSILKNTKIQNALSSYMKAFIGEHKDKLEYKILHQLYTRAFYNTFDIIDEDGELRDIDTMSKDLQQCIVGIKKTMHPKDASTTVTEVKLACRDKARKELEVYINMLHVENVTTLKVDTTQKDKLRAILGNVDYSGFQRLPKEDRNPIEQLGDK